MAGRGTDIVLGGNLEAEVSLLPAGATLADIEQLKADWHKRHEQVVNAGGLHIIGSERHESRRIDNQLRGRAGRQGDSGSSRFYLSLQDNLMRIFASDRLSFLMQKLGMQEGEAIEHPWITKAIENAQRKVEARNFDIRKQLLEFDDVANEQRKIIYQQRDELLASADISGLIGVIREDVVQEVISLYIEPHSLEEQWNIAGLERHLADDFLLILPIQEWLEKEEHLHEETLRARILAAVNDAYQHKEDKTGSPIMRQLEKNIMLQNLDVLWKEHLAAMDHLRQGIHLRGYAQKNPKQEYKRESFELFSQMLEQLKFNVISVLSKIQIQAQDDIQVVEQQRRQQSSVPMQFQHAEINAMGNETTDIKAEVKPANSPIPIMRAVEKIGRNEPCSCGSGKKYKHCHGQIG
jgi:preprotein translocase subunit SecA